MDDLYAVNFVEPQSGYSTPAPALHRLVTISGHNVWGIDLATDEMTAINRSLGDGSGRSYRVKAFVHRDAAERFRNKLALEQQSN